MDAHKLVLACFLSQGDSLKSCLGSKFSTKDRDYDKSPESCSKQRGKAGWWFKKCGKVNLNGIYYSEGEKKADGMAWETWKGADYSLESVKMMVREFEADIDI